MRQTAEAQIQNSLEKVNPINGLRIADSCHRLE